MLHLRQPALDGLAVLGGFESVDDLFGGDAHPAFLEAVLSRMFPLREVGSPMVRPYSELPSVSWSGPGASFAVNL
jgi:hypothetical protein